MELFQKGHKNEDILLLTRVYLKINMNVQIILPRQ